MHGLNAYNPHNAVSEPVPILHAHVRTYQPMTMHMAYCCCDTRLQTDSIRPVPNTSETADYRLYEDSCTNHEMEISHICSMSVVRVRMPRAPFVGHVHPNLILLATNFSMLPPYPNVGCGGVPSTPAPQPGRRLQLNRGCTPGPALATHGRNCSKGRERWMMEAGSVSFKTQNRFDLRTHLDLEDDVVRMMVMLVHNNCQYHGNNADEHQPKGYFEHRHGGRNCGEGQRYPPRDCGASCAPLSPKAHQF